MSNIYAVYDPETGEIRTVYVVPENLIDLQMRANPGMAYVLVGREGDPDTITLKEIGGYRVQDGRLVKK